MKTLSQILNSSHDTHLTESASTKILITTLYALGFKEAKGSDMRSFKGVPKEEILNLYGIPMRAGKWADVWFAILEDDVYIVVNNNNVYEYGEVSDAIKAIQKIGVRQKKLVGEALQEVYRPVSKRVIRAMGIIVDFDEEEYEELLFSLAHEASKNSEGVEDVLKDVSDILFKAAKTWKAFRPPSKNEDVELNEKSVEDEIATLGKKSTQSLATYVAKNYTNAHSYNHHRPSGGYKKYFKAVLDVLGKRNFDLSSLKGQMAAYGHKYTPTSFDHYKG